MHTSGLDILSMAPLFSRALTTLACCQWKTEVAPVTLVTLVTLITPVTPVAPVALVAPVGSSNFFSAVVQNQS